MWVVTQPPDMFMSAIGATPHGGLVVGRFLSVAFVSANKIPPPPDRLGVFVMPPISGFCMPR